MTTVTLVTSFSPDGYQTYGKRMLETACEFLPQNVEIKAYFNKERPSFSNSRVDFIDAYAIDGGVRDFIEKHSGNRRHCGYHPNSRQEEYNFRWDAVKFCHKPYAIEHCSRTCKSNILVWLDADSLIFDYIPAEWFTSLLPYPHYLAFLARSGYSHSDCSFLSFRTNNAAHREFMNRYLGIYKHGRFEQEKESHDSYLFDLVRKEMQRERKITCYNLSKEDKGHTFISSELGRYMDTLKGKRKETGSSWREDLTVHRSEPYWQNLPKRQ